MEIRRAHKNDEETLAGIMLDAGMDLAGDIEYHVVIIVGGKVAGGLMLSANGGGFHIEVIATDENMRGRGIGRALIKAVAAEPWKYADSSTEARNSRVTAIAKGSSLNFYKNSGFTEIPFSELEAEYQNQCGECPDKEDCSPAAVIYKGERQ